MKRIYLAALLLSGLACSPVRADIQRVAGGGVAINVAEVLAAGEPGVLVFHASWDTASVQLVAGLEAWSLEHPGVKLVLIDVVDERTQVFRQFDLQTIPSILVLDSEHVAVGATVADVDDMEAQLREHDLL